MFNDIDEANKAASDAEWASPHFELQRDIPEVSFHERMDICRSCDKLSVINFCGECGCFMPLKTRLRGSSCPIGKWQAIVYQPSPKEE